jgi:hypothetical protein
VAPLKPGEPGPEIPDLLRRIDALLARGADVLLFRERELYAMTAFVNRYTRAPLQLIEPSRQSDGGNTGNCKAFRFVAS